jgi:hypothetical protein
MRIGEQDRTAIPLHFQQRKAETVVQGRRHKVARGLVQRGKRGVGDASLTHQPVAATLKKLVCNFQAEATNTAGLITGLTWHVQQDVHKLC